MAPCAVCSECRGLTVVYVKQYCLSWTWNCFGGGCVSVIFVVSRLLIVYLIRDCQYEHYCLDYGKRTAFYINSVVWDIFHHQIKFNSDCIDTVLMKDIPLYLETIN